MEKDSDEVLNKAWFLVQVQLNFCLLRDLKLDNWPPYLYTFFFVIPPCVYLSWRNGMKLLDIWDGQFKEMRSWAIL